MSQISYNNEYPIKRIVKIKPEKIYKSPCKKKLSIGIPKMQIDSNHNNNTIVEIKSTEKKEEQPAKKYNRFRRFNINKDNNDGDNNKNNEIRISNNKPEIEKKEIVEEKTTITKKVYKTRRPFNANNNIEEKKEEKVEVIEKKDRSS